MHRGPELCEGSGRFLYLQLPDGGLRYQRILAQLFELRVQVIQLAFPRVREALRRAGYIVDGWSDLQNGHTLHSANCHVQSLFCGAPNDSTTAARLTTGFRGFAPDAAGAMVLHMDQINAQFAIFW